MKLVEIAVKDSKNYVNLKLKEKIIMSGLKIIAILLIGAGVFGLAYGNFSYIKETHEAKLGPLELSVKDKENVTVPVWMAVGAIIAGGAMLLTRKTA